MTKIVFLMGLLMLFLQSCLNDKNENALKNEKFNLLFIDSCNIDSMMPNGAWNYKAINAKDAKTGVYYSRTDIHEPYGISYKSSFPTPTLHKNIKLVIEAFVKTDNIDNSCLFGLSISQKDSVINWFGININKNIKQKNTWTFVSDTMIIPQSIAISKNTLSFFLWNDGGNGTVDADDVKIKYFELKSDSYVPKLNSEFDSIHIGKQIYKNDYYTLNYNQENGHLFIGNKNGDNLANAISYYLDYKINQTSKINTYASDNLKLISQTDTSFTFGIKDVILDFTCTFITGNTSELKVISKTKYNKDIVVVRESVIARYKDNLKEVYTDNRKLNSDYFQDEYWLNKEGFKIGDGINAMIAYHESDISSIQLNTINKLIVFNLDYHYDHLRMTFPLIMDSTKKGIKQDLSCTERFKNTVSENHFTFNIGLAVKTLPRFMKNPKGFLATYIFTEHADFSDMKAQRAVNYGSDNIYNFKDAIGGFAGNKIPVTKSVFYHNPDKVSNKLFNKKFTSEICNIKSMPDFSNMLNELSKNGFEICLHTPEEYTTNTEYLKEALTYFNSHFNSKTWIDHGYDNPQKNNREDFVCDGFNKSSTYYAQPLFKQNNICYFWNCYNEDSVVFGKFSYDNNLKNPYPGFGDFLPNPDYSKHIINGEMVVSWQTPSLLLPRDATMWSYFFSDQRLQNFINDYEVCINHCYPARVDSFTGFYDIDEKGKIVINNEFNNILKKLAAQRDKGAINTTTVKDFLDYNLAVEKIEYKMIDEHHIKLINKNNFTINGLSMIIKSKFVEVKNKKLNQKTDGEHLIFWFDINAKEEVIVSF